MKFSIRTEDNFILNVNSSAADGNHPLNTTMEQRNILTSENDGTSKSQLKADDVKPSIEHTAALNDCVHSLVTEQLSVWSNVSETTDTCHVELGKDESSVGNTVDKRTGVSGVGKGEPGEEHIHHQQAHSTLLGTIKADDFKPVIENTASLSDYVLKVVADGQLPVLSNDTETSDFWHVDVTKDEASSVGKANVESTEESVVKCEPDENIYHQQGHNGLLETFKTEDESKDSVVMSVEEEGNLEHGSSSDALFKNAGE